MESKQNPKCEDADERHEIQSEELASIIHEHREALDSHQVFRETTETTLGEHSEQLKKSKQAEQVRDQKLDELKNSVDANQETLAQTQETLAQTQETLAQMQEILAQNQTTLNGHDKKLGDLKEAVDENQKALYEHDMRCDKDKALLHLELKYMRWVGLVLVIPIFLSVVPPAIRMFGG